MADDLAAAGFDTKGLLKQLMGNADRSAAYTAGKEGEFSASVDRETAARAAQQAALTPKRDELKAKLDQGAPQAPELQSAPTPPTPGIDPQQMKETLSLVTALAAFGGALTREPLTAALNNFSAGVHGLVQGNQQVYQNELKSFEANLQKSKTENDSIWKKYQAAREKYGTDIAGLQSELSLIAAESQNPIDMELARRGDIVSLMKIHETTNNNYNKVLEQTMRFMEAQQTHRDQMAATAEQRKIANSLAERRLGVSETREGRLSGKDARAVEDGLRREHDKIAKPIEDYERDIAKVRTAILTGTPLGKTEAQQLLTSLTKGARGTNMQMKITSNFGDLGTRMGGFFTNFLSGQWTDEQKRQVTGFLDGLQQTVVDPEKSALRQRYEFLANQRKVNPENVIYGGAPAGGGDGAFDPNAFLDGLK